MSKQLRGARLIITAGPTRERWDAIRFLSNYSSGRMGYALAAEARRLGAKVTLVSGPVGLEPPTGVKTIQVESARQMKLQVMRLWPRARLLLMAAAVADFRPRFTLAVKIKKRGLSAVAPPSACQQTSGGAKTSSPWLELVRNPDILAACGAHKGNRYLVGFAAESTRLVVMARGKLRAKNLDCIAANLVGGANGAMGGEHTRLILLFADGRQVRLGRMSKARAAKRLLEEVGKDMGRSEKEKVKRKKEKVQ